MVREITQNLFSSLTAGMYENFFIVLTNQYFPFGLFWWIIGLVLFSVIHIKTKNMAYAGMLTAFYFISIPETGLVTNVFSITGMRIFGIILGMIIGYYVYKSVKDD